MRNSCQHGDIYRCTEFKNKFGQPGLRPIDDFVYIFIDWCRDCGAIRESSKLPKKDTEHGRWKSPKSATEEK